MEDKLLERVEALLKEEGFTRIAKHFSSHSATLSAEKGALRAVIHLTDQEELPSRAGRNEEVPLPSEIRMSATLLGAKPSLAGQAIPRAGQSGGLKKMERVKRR